MRNERGAGRKARFSREEIERIRSRHAAGEKVSTLAKEYGVSRQTLSKYLNPVECYEVEIDFGEEGKKYTQIYVNETRESLHVVNYAMELSKRAFGWNENPTWDDFLNLIEQECVKDAFVCLAKKTDSISLKKLSANSSVKITGEADVEFRFTKKDLIIARTDTDGFQLKALSSDRRWFVKSQALISGVLMDDWLVEIEASDICKQLGIKCVEQMPCRFILGSKEYNAVYSKNFELDGYTFISFERLLELNGKSSESDEFLKLESIEKLKWCARQLSEIGCIDYADTLKYMLDLCIVDILVGNIDRHTKNFGLFFNAYTGKYEIALLFDNGMGLFENDYYRDNYKSYEEAMKNVYVSPYGEDPFEMLDMINREFDIIRIYPELVNVKFSGLIQTEYALLYQRKMLEKVRGLYGRA